MAISNRFENTGWKVGTAALLTVATVPASEAYVRPILHVYNGDTANAETVVIEITDAAGVPVVKNGYNEDLAPKQTKRYVLPTLKAAYVLKVNASADVHFMLEYIRDN